MIWDYLALPQTQFVIRWWPVLLGSLLIALAALDWRQGFRRP